MLKMDFYYFHRFSWKKIAENDRSHAMDISRITKAILKNCQTLEKWPFNCKNNISKKFEKSAISNGTRYSQPKYHNSSRKTVTGSLKKCASVT